MLNIKRIFILQAFIIICQTAFGQTVLLHEKISAYDFKLPGKGPNYRHFSHLFIGFGFFIPDGDPFEVETKPGSTTALEFGWRYKLKLTNWLAIGSGVNYINEIFDIKQIEEKVVPTAILHSKEKLRFNNVGSEFFLRFNFGKRGNIIGKFVDLGTYANWAFKVKHMYQDKSNSQLPYQAESVRVILYNLKYVERFNYGLKARIGVNRYVVTGSYRLNELLTEDYKNIVGDYYLPRLSIGLEIGLHK